MRPVVLPGICDERLRTTEFIVYQRIRDSGILFFREFKWLGVTGTNRDKCERFLLYNIRNIITI